jgi:hypothetical protein
LIQQARRICRALTKGLFMITYGWHILINLPALALFGLAVWG